MRSMVRHQLRNVNLDASSSGGDSSVQSSNGNVVDDFTSQGSESQA
jgi:hypothetical protein